MRTEEKIRLTLLEAILLSMLPLTGIFLMIFLNMHEATLDDGIDSQIVSDSVFKHSELYGRITSCKVFQGEVGIRLNTQPKQIVFYVEDNYNYPWSYQNIKTCIHTGDSIYKGANSDSIRLITHEVNYIWKISWR